MGLSCTQDDETVTERKGEEEKGKGREDDYKQQGTCRSACIHTHTYIGSSEQCSCAIIFWDLDAKKRFQLAAKGT